MLALARRGFFVLKTYAAAPVLGAVCALGVVGSVMLTSPADAKASFASAYGYDRTWNAALRLVRVDNGWKITEKDDASGYVLFDYVSPEGGNKATPGSIELVRSGGDDDIRVVVQLPKMPRYHEQVLADQLASKMRQEYGDPPPRKKPQPAPAPSDAGADSD